MLCRPSPSQQQNTLRADEEEAATGEAGAHRNCLVLRPHPSWKRPSSSEIRPPPGLAEVPLQIASQYSQLYVEESTTGTTTSTASLFALPKPQNRSSKLQYERSQRARKGLYSGEMEPEGRRGDYASAETVPDGFDALPADDVVPLRDFSSAAPTPRPMVIGSPIPPSRVQQTRKDDIDSETNNTSSKIENERLQQQQQPSRRPPKQYLRPLSLSPTPELDSSLPLQFSTKTGGVIRGVTQNDGNDNNDEEEEEVSNASTKSDEDMMNMREDLLPTNSEVEQSQNHHRDNNYSSLQRQPQSTRKQPNKKIDVSSQNSTANTTQSSSWLNTSQHSNSSSLVHSLNSRAMDHVKKNEYEHALELFSQVLTIQQQAHGSTHPAVASAYHNLGTLFAKHATTVSDDSTQQRQLQTRALQEFQAAARTARDSLGRNHPNVAVSLVRIGFLLLQARQYHNAVVTFLEALRIRIAALGPQHGLVANLYNNLGVCNLHLSQFQQGWDYLQQALTIQRKNCVVVAAKRGDNDDSSVWIQQLELADTLFNIGGLCLEWIRQKGPDLRRAVDAEETFAEALEIRSEILEPEDPMVQQVKALLETAQTLPRPKLRGLSPSRLLHQHDSQRARSPTVQQRRKHAVRAPLPPITRKPNTPETLEPPSLTLRQTLGDSSESSRPFDEQSTSVYQYSIQRAPSRDMQPSISPLKPLEPPPDIVRTPKTLESVLSSPSEAQPSSPRYRQFPSPSRQTAQPAVLDPIVSLPREVSSTVATPPRLNNAAIVTPSSTMNKRYDDNDGPRQDKYTTKVYLTPQLVPQSPVRVVDAIRLRSSTDILAIDCNEDKQMLGQGLKSFSYDAEEHCLINGSGIDSEHGRIHYPNSWSKAGLDKSDTASVGRSIMISSPFRRRSNQTAPRLNNFKENDHKTPAYIFSTGNAERDALMNRASALINKYNDETGIEKRTVEGRYPNLGSIRILQKSSFDEDVLEDGIAALSGDWVREQKAPPIDIMIKDPMNHLHSIHDEAARLLQTENLSTALDLFNIVLDCQRRRNRNLSADVASALHNVGIAQLRVQKHEDALNSFEEAASIRIGTLGRDHAQVAVSLVKVGITLMLLHRYEDSLWSFQEALSVRKRVMGALHPSTARIYNNIGCVHVELNQFRDAKHAFESALDIQKSAMASDSASGPLVFGTATTLCNLGYLYRSRDMHAKATIVLEEAADLYEAVLGPRHETVFTTLDCLADSCANSGATSDSLKYYNIILERFHGRSKTKKGVRAEGMLLYKMSRVHKQRHDTDAQLDKLQRALSKVRIFNELQLEDGGEADTLERRIQFEIKECRAKLEKEQWR